MFFSKTQILQEKFLCRSAGACHQWSWLPPLSVYFLLPWLPHLSFYSLLLWLLNINFLLLCLLNININHPNICLISTKPLPSSVNFTFHVIGIRCEIKHQTIS